MATHNSNTNVVFIDTNLDTHLALVVSNFDTVSDLKKRIVSEHPLCFPKIGQIQIHGIKVKRKGYFYHLSDSMLVGNAFLGFNKSWFLSVDASALGEPAQNEQLFSHGSPYQVASLGFANNALIGSGDKATSFPSERVSRGGNLQLLLLDDKRDRNEEIPVASLCVSEHSSKEAVKNSEVGVKSSGNNDTGIPLPGSISKAEKCCIVNHEITSLHAEGGVDGFSKDIKNDCSVLEEPVPSSKKKRKSKREKEDAVQDDHSKDDIASVDNPLGFQSNMASGFNHLQVLQSQNNQDENEDIPFDGGLNREPPNSLIECKVDGSNKGIKDDFIVFNEGTTKSVPSAKRKKKSKRKHEDTVRDDNPKEIDTSVVGHSNCTVRQDVEFERNKVTENILDSRPPAKKKKKKKKGKEKSGDKSLSKANLINDLMVDDASHLFLDSQEKIKNSHTDQSAEDFNDADSLKTSVSGRTRKEKINKSSPHETPVVTSSKKDEEADRSSIQREGVQEEKTQDGVFSKGGISTSKTTLDNMGIGTDACGEGIQSTIIRTGKNKNHCDIQTKVHPSDVSEPMELNGDAENVVLGHCQKSEACHTEGAEEGREAPPQNDPKLMLLEKCSTSKQGNADANITETNVTSKVVDVNGMTEPPKSEKRKRGKSKAKKLGGGPSLSEGIGIVDASESETDIMKSPKATNCDPMPRNTDAEENSLNQTEGQKIQQEEMQGAILSATEKEGDFSANNAGSLEQIKTKSNAEQMDERQGGKSNNNQTSTSKSVSDTLTKDQVLDSKKPSLSIDIGTHASPSVNKSKKSRSASTKSTTKSSKSNLEPAKDSVGIEPSGCQFNFGGNETSQFPSNSPKGSSKLGHFESNDAAQDSTLLSREKDDNSVQQFASQKQRHEAKLSDDMRIDEMNGADRTDFETTTQKNMHVPEASKGQTHAECLISSPQLSSKEESDVPHQIQSDNKVKNIRSRTGLDAKLSSRSDSAMSSIGENRKRQVNVSRKSMDLEKRKVPNPKLVGYKNTVPNKSGKPSGNNVAGVGRNAQQKKSLLAGSIFKDDSSSSSEDEDRVDNSDVSTRTPSDNSLLSDFSDGDSSAGQDPQQNGSGSHGGNWSKNGERSSLKSSLTATKGMSIDRVLKSSRRYKKAKVLASQLEESESQPDFVPDSLAD